MFQVSASDPRLNNKEEVLVMRLRDPQTEGPRPLAITAAVSRKQSRFFTIASQDGTWSS